MDKLRLYTLSALFLLALTLGCHSAYGQKRITLETPHYRIAYEKKHSQLAGEILKVAESVWPTLAKAYDSYNRYERIDILITDNGDEANGYAIFNFSRVAIYAPHMDWVMRNRQSWIQNVVTHELAHIFSLRRTAHLSPVDAVMIYGSTYNYSDRVNYSFQLPWVPLVAPTWYIEGIAQFEAAENGNDSWDSQRDMVVRDAYLTGTLPELDFIETFEYDEDWTQAERCYNTGFAFLLYLKDRFGADKVRDLAKPKPLFNFTYSVERAFGKSLTQLYGDFKHSLADRYADFKEIIPDALADKEMEGGYQQDLAFSSDGRFMAWLGNDENRRYPMNWIYWKEIGENLIHQSQKPTEINPSPSALPGVVPAGTAPWGTTPASPQLTPLSKINRHATLHGQNEVGKTQGGFNRPRFANPSIGLAKSLLPNYQVRSSERATRSNNLPSALHGRHDCQMERSIEPGSSGLEFNHDNSKLLTTRQDRYATFTDIWEYNFRSKLGEEEKWQRLTWEERAAYPSYHPSKNLIVYTRKKSGSSNLAVLDSTGKSVLLTNFSNGEQVYNPRYTPRGDSIYFTLGIMDQEAIVSLNAAAPIYDPFLVGKDSTLFPDSLNLAKNQKLNFFTPLRKGGIRNLRFSNDTLFWSSNMHDSSLSVYNIYAKLPHDSALYRATQVAGQALEALPRNGVLFYQGYRKQRFQLYQQPLKLTRTQDILRTNTDSIPTTKPKKEDYTKVFDTGEFGGSKAALDITPYLAVQPQFISGDKSYTDLALGLSLTLGESYGSWMQTFSGAITKRADLDNPMNYQVAYSGFISSDPVRHTFFTWPVDLYYSVYHDVVQSNDTYIDQGNFIFDADTLFGRSISSVYSNFSREAVSAVMPIPSPIFPKYAGMALEANYWRQVINQDFSQKTVLKNNATGGELLQTVPRTTLLKDAPQHRHLNSGLTWYWSRGSLATFLPSGLGVSLSARKWWAQYQVGESAELDSALSLQLTQRGEVVPLFALPQAQYEPWSLDFAYSGVWSPGKSFSLFAGGEFGAFLNKTPRRIYPAYVSKGDTTFAEDLEPGLWAMTYRLGYFRLQGYPYNFNYQGRDIMEGSSYAYGQYGFQIPLKTGHFIPDLPVTSFKQILVTGMGEWGTSLIKAPGAILNSLENGEHDLLMDFGLRISMNFKLYHQYPFTLYAQGFVPYNFLKAESLQRGDYSEPTSSDVENRRRYIRQIKEPRFFIGFNLGTF